MKKLHVNLVNERAFVLNENQMIDILSKCQNRAIGGEFMKLEVTIHHCKYNAWKSAIDALQASCVANGNKYIYTWLNRVKTPDMAALIAKYAPAPKQIYHRVWVRGTSPGDTIRLDEVADGFTTKQEAINFVRKYRRVGYMLDKPIYSTYEA